MSWHDLLTASRNGDEKKLLKLLANTNVKLQLNQLNQNNFTALHLSMVHHHYTCALLLLEAGADPYAGAPHNSLLDTYTAAQRLMLVKLFLWYNPHYEEVICRSGKTALQRIKGWDCAFPGHGILASIDHTKTVVLQYQNNLKQAEKQLSIANNVMISKEQNEQAYLLAAVYFINNAGLLLQAFEDAKQDEYERVHQPSTYQAITQHYHTKAVSCLKSAIDCYKKVSILNMTTEQHGEYIAGLEKLICHASANEKRHYAAELANLLVSLGQLPPYATQKTIYLEKAKNLYESVVLTADYANEEFNQNIFYLKNAVQLYQQLAAEQVGETRQRTLESAIGLYYQIADYYFTKQKSERQLAEVYRQQAQLLEQALHPQENQYHAPLSSSYPLHQRRNITSKKKVFVTEDAIQVAAPLLNKIP